MNSAFIPLVARHRRLLWPVAVALLLVAALVVLLLARRELQQQSHVQSARNVIAQDGLRQGAIESPPCTRELAYARALPSSTSLDALVGTMQESAKAFDVTIRSVSGEPRAETRASLASLDVSIALRGSYGGIKSVLAESLARFPNSVVTRLQLKRDTAMTAVAVEEASIELSLAFRPTDVGAVECRGEPPRRGQER